MAQVNGLRPQDWATYQDGSNQWTLLEEVAAQESAGGGETAAYAGGYGSAADASSGYGTWMQPPAPPPLSYVTMGYTEYGDPICVPVEAPQAPVAATPAPPPITYTTVGYTEYGDPISAPVPTAAPAPQPVYPVSYNQGHGLAQETVYAAPAPVPAVVYQSYDQAAVQGYASVCEAPAPAPMPVAAPAPAPAAGRVSQWVIGEISESVSSPAPAPTPSPASTPAPTPAAGLSVSTISSVESSETTAEASPSATHGTRRRALDFDWDVGSTGDDGFGSYDIGSGDFNDGWLDESTTSDDEFDLFAGFDDDSLNSDSFDNDPFDSDPFDNDPFDNEGFDWSQTSTLTGAYGPFAPGGLDQNLGGLGSLDPSVNLGTGSVGIGNVGTNGEYTGVTGAVTGSAPVTNTATETTVGGEPTDTAVAGGHGADTTIEIPLEWKSIFNTLGIVPQDPTQFVGPPSAEQQWMLGASGLLLAHSDTLQLATYAAGIASIFGGVPGDLDESPSMATSLGVLNSVGIGVEAAPGQLDEALHWLQRVTGTLPTAAEVVGTAAMLAKFGVSVVLLVTPGNIGQGQSVIHTMNATQRLVTDPGALYGDLQELDANGNWQTVKSGARLYEVKGEKKAWTDAEAAAGLAQLKASINTPLGGVDGYTTDNQVKTGSPELGTTSNNASGTTTTPNGNGLITTGSPASGTTEVGPPYITTTPITQPSWADSIMESKDSKALGDSLTAAGEARPAAGYQPHHMIPINDSRGADLLEQLKAAGIDPNSAVNGVWLPGNTQVQGNGETSHNQTMRDSYYDYLAVKFSSSNGTAEDIISILQQVKIDLLNGKTFPLKN